MQEFELEDALLNVLASFIFKLVGDQSFSSGFVHFLAVLGIDAPAQRLRRAKHYSYMLAGVAYCIRVLGVEKLLPSAKRSKQTNKDCKRFLAKRVKYLANSLYSLIS
ncbi:uncharacterized protein BDR25DRAFT_245432 [Lindgomyces ingoldianus]|uniref:Uncharacterized protein n=1 Tax=Lindgomyces ingoldianus TaxID=673940 RepID=A0ACB6QB15_9PLEO|nr:uncharacterized protein BDR25DRAFT_245432 [Lindgomyces ingoldianus]KAF2463572.1 hypothetical protein BDR25DRAFT_245432 [Lindgomyces ingoldianus]